MKSLINWLVILSALLVLFIATLGFFAWRDTQIANSSQVYEDCVQAHWGITPANYYQLTGFYPECSK